MPVTPSDFIPAFSPYQADRLVELLTGGAGTGDVVGPASAVNNNLAAFDLTTGKVIKDSGVATSALVTGSSTTTLTNKTIDADASGNSITNIENADIKAAAAIALDKLAATTVSRALVSGVSGFVTAATTTATEIGYVNGVTSAIQTQINAIAGGTKTYAVFTPSLNQPPAANFATPDTRNSIAVLDFDDSTGEDAIFLGVVPQSAALGSGLIVVIKWTATTATSGAVVWVVSFMGLTTDIDSDSFDTSATATTTTNATSGIPNTTSITITTIDSIVAADAYRLKVSRNAGSGSDTMTGDAEIISVEVRSAA